MQELHKGKHVMIDVRGASKELCENDELLLQLMVEGAKKAGMKVINQIRYRFDGITTQPGCTCFVTLDTSHVSVHTYADTGQQSWDCYTCGTADPMIIWEHIQSVLQFDDYCVEIVERFK